MEETYFGDEVYASFDGYQICLRAPREHGNDKVYLELSLFHALVAFAAKAWPMRGA